MKAPFAILVIAFAIPTIANSSGYKQALIAGEPAAFAYNTCKVANGDLGSAKETLLDVGWIESNELDDIIQFWTHARYVNVRAKLSRVDKPTEWSDETIRASYPSTMFATFEDLKKRIEIENNGHKISYDSYETKSDRDRENGLYKTSNGQNLILITHYTNHYSCYFLGLKSNNPALIDAFQERYTWASDKSAHQIRWYIQNKQKLSVTSLSNEATSADPRLPTEYDLFFSTSFPQQKDTQ